MKLSSTEDIKRQPDLVREPGLVVATNFIRGVRDLGYMGLSSALSEVIDNSLQAEAEKVQVKIVRNVPEEPPTISVLDNGHGMTLEELEACLQFGGTKRFDDRQSFGRFGIGLPAASLSQTTQVEVISWQESRHSSTVSIDVDRVAAGFEPALSPQPKDLTHTSRSGCEVIWHRCDRVEYKRLGWLEKALHRDLGRVYRRFLLAGLDLSINGTRVAPYDPMFLEDGSAIGGQKASLAFEPLKYSIATSNGGSSNVTVRFSMLPIHRWHQLDNANKRRYGIVNSGGVSILRAGREIAFGWHLMGDKRKENYDDWWRCEISFEPDLDEQFGITINKQGIRPSDQLRDALEPELASIARLLNTRVRQQFEDVKFREAAEASCRIATTADPSLPAINRGRGKRHSGPLSYRLTSESLSSGNMFEVEQVMGLLTVRINVDHPAFQALYGPLQSAGDETEIHHLRTAVELLILSYARSSLFPESDRILPTWSATYARMLQKR